MNTYLLLIRLHQLKCCNKVLISLYDRLDSADEDSKKICIERLKKRRIIKKELEDIISKLRNQKGLLVEKNLYYLISSILNTAYFARSIYQQYNFEEILKLENKNLHLYYVILYIPGTPKPIIDKLLDQKKEIENILTQGS